MFCSKSFVRGNEIVLKLLGYAQHSFAASGAKLDLEIVEAESSGLSRKGGEVGVVKEPVLNPALPVDDSDSCLKRRPFQPQRAASKDVPRVPQL